eukprot:s887_g16.t1
MRLSPRERRRRRRGTWCLWSRIFPKGVVPKFLSQAGQRLRDFARALVKQKIKSLEEFRYFFEPESEIGLWVQKLSLGEHQSLQTARPRRTWAAVKVFFQHADAGRAKVSEADLGDLLDDTALRDMKQQFWRRYKTRFPPELYPSDATLSRVTRELNKRMLCVFSVWKVKSLQFQLVSTSKKRKLGKNLFTEDQELEEVVPRDWESYLDRLQILLTAYSLTPLAGVQAVAGSFDVVMEYFYRAKCSASQIQPQKRLAWLQHRDTEERAAWVSKFRESTKTLGSVVREVMNLRDAHWIYTRHDCPFDEFLPRHLQHVRDNLLDQLPELFGKTLVVDSITTFPSEGDDALAGLVFEALSEQARAPRAASTRKSAKRLVNRSAGSFPKAPGIALAPLVDASQVLNPTRTSGTPPK